MKLNTNILKQVLIILTIFLSFTTITGQILNGSFENDSTPDLSNWESRCYDAELVSSTPPDGGNWSIKVAGGDYQGCFPNYIYQKIPAISNGQTFLLTGWALGETTRLYFGKINSDVITLLSGSNTSASSWTQLSIQTTFSLSEGDTAIVALSVGTIGGGASLYGYFDLIKLEQVEGINSIQHKISLKLYPNPFNKQTTLSTDKILNNAILTMNNIYGQVVKQIENINGQTIFLKRDNLSKGIYFIQLSENNLNLTSKKIIITD